MQNEPIANEPISNFQSLTTRLRSAQRVVALTGAGMSAESGIPTFRDPQSGLWVKHDPAQLATVGASERDPKIGVGLVRVAT